MSKVPCMRPSVCFEVQKIIGVSFGHGNTRNYQVQWAPTWISSTNLIGCEHLIDDFNSTRNRLENDMEDQEMVDDGDNIHIPSGKYIVNHTASSSNEADFLLKPNHLMTSFSTITNDDERRRTYQNIAKPFSHMSDDSECAKVICMDDENDISNKMIDLNSTPCGNFEKNPNFEWRRMGRNELDEEDEQTLPRSYEDPTMNEQSIPIHALHGNEDEDEEDDDEDEQVQDNERDLDSPNTDQDDRMVNTSTEDFEDHKVTIKTLKSEPNDISEGETNTQARDAAHTEDAKPSPSGSSRGRNYPLWTEHTYFHSGKRIYECMLCNTTFSTKGNLTTHFKLHTGYKPYQCLECNKFFSRKHHLTDHLRLHTGEKPFQCTYCHKAFTRNHHLKDHVRVHHREKEAPTMASDTGVEETHSVADGSTLVPGSSVSSSDPSLASSSLL